MLLLEKLTQEKRIPYTELARFVGISDTSISRHIKDYTHIGLKEYEKLFNYLTDNKYEIDLENLVIKHMAVKDNFQKTFENEQNKKEEYQALIRERDEYKNDFIIVSDDLQQAQQEIEDYKLEIKKLKEIIKNLSNII